MHHAHSPTLNRLSQGIRQFQQRYYHNEPERMQELVEQGQHPEVLLISCSDSRVDPALLTGALPGDLFIVRNVANLVPPYQLDSQYDGARAAIEYAVRDLQVKHIVVLGHAQCGGIKALLGSMAGQSSPREFIGAWVSIASDAYCRHVLNHSSDQSTSRAVDVNDMKAHQYLVERAAILGSLANLTTYPWLHERMQQNGLSLHGWWFDLETGDLWVTDSSNTLFLPLLD
ncbi:MAG: carbonic anhydrase [Methylococcaceae bacterium]